MKNARDETYMKRAIELALKGWGATSPNPLVGAVVVKGGRVVGEGYHRRAGSPHAEINALRKAGTRAKGATLYVTLEPCCHQGRTPPCIDRIVEAGIARVVVGTRDPNPVVNGRGIRILKRAGVDVRAGVLREACRDINRPYEMAVVHGRPFVILKAAVSLDGKIATGTGDSKWITGAACRSYVHRLRSGADAIMVGRGTVVKDDPRLTVRLPGRRARAGKVVILDEKLDVSRNAKVLARPAGNIIFATTTTVSAARVKKLRGEGYDVIVCPPTRKQHVLLPHLLPELAQRGVNSVLVEGGGETFGAFMDSDLVDHLVMCIAPTIIGGEGRDVFANLRIDSLRDAFRLNDVTFRTLGNDMVVEGSL